MIRSGYLSSLVGKQIFTTVELSKVGISKGDFIASELARVVNTPERNQLIVDSFIEHALDRQKTLAFCVDVQHAKDLASAFEERGIPAQSVYGAMANDERLNALHGFSNGQYKILTNCQLLTEGFDEPGIDCVIMGRPTQSSSLFTQMIGRGTRNFPLKKNCLVLDFTDNATKHSLCTYRNTLDGAVLPLYDHESTPDEERLNVIADANTRCDAIKILEERVEEISFFENVHFAWNPVGDAWHLILGSDREVWVKPVVNGFLIEAHQESDCLSLSKRPLPLNYALGIAEDWARKQTTKNSWAKKDAAWRMDPATQKQKEALMRYGIMFDMEISKGQASQLLDSRFNEPATVKQIYWLRAHGISVTNSITKLEARKMIAERAQMVRI